jgi:hypothetical protein
MDDRTLNQLMEAAEEDKKDEPAEEAGAVKDEDIKKPDIHLDEKETKATDDLKNDDSLPNIWSFNDGEKIEDEDRFDKPSFLRRLRRHKKDNPSDKE